MDMRLIAIVLVLGTVALFSEGGVTLSLVSREECIKQVVDQMEVIELDDAIKARVAEARQYYHVDVDDSNKLSSYGPESCDRLREQMQMIKATVTCFRDRSIMGNNESQSVSDVIRASERARLAIEASFACSEGKYTARMLRNRGIFDAIVYGA